MIQAIVDARRFSAGDAATALAAPLGPEGQQRSVGPFVVLAHLLPLDVAAGELAPNFDVRPHPHIGLAALTYMLDGHVTHRDSLGFRCEVGPGAINYMVAGRGIVHSERYDRLRTLGGRLQLLQILLALPDGFEESSPSFFHVGSEQVPDVRENGAAVRWVAGSTRERESRVSFPSRMFMHDVQLEAGGRYSPPEGFSERALYVLDGSIALEGTPVRAQQTAVLGPGRTHVEAAKPARVIAFGGEPAGPRYMWWNFIHSSLEKLEAAKAEWRAGRMPLPLGDTESFAPAPPDNGRPLLRLNAER